MAIIPFLQSAASQTARGLLAILLVTVIGLAIVTGVSSLSWPLIQDSPILFYIARQIVDHGLVPYRDVFDMNMPGTYLAYGLIDTLSMRTELGLRCIDLLLLSALAVLSFRMYPRLALSGRLYAAFMFPLIYLGLGPKASFQREYLALIPLALAVYLLVRASRGPWTLRLFASGFCYGLVATIKPHLLIGLPFVLACLLTRSGLSFIYVDSRRTFVLRQLPLFVLGFTFPVLTALIYLFRVDALHPLYVTWREYLPLYGKISYFLTILPEGQYLKYHLQYLFMNYNYVPIVALGGLAVFFHTRSPETTGREQLPIMLIGSQCLAYWAYPSLSGQYWFYHWLPLAYWLSLILAPVVVLNRSPFPTAFRFIAVAALFFWVFMATRPDLGLVALEDHNKASRVALARDLSSELEQRLEPGDRVQPLDWAHAGVTHGLLLADAPLATSFVYNFHFYHHVSTPYIQALREQFISELENEQPRFIVQGFPGPPYMTGPDTTGKFEALARFMVFNYRVVHQGPVFSEGGKVSYRIWERNT